MKKNENDGIEFPENFTTPSVTTDELQKQAEVTTIALKLLVKKEVEKVNEVPKQSEMKTWQQALMSLPNKFSQLSIKPKRTTIELGYATMIIKNNNALKSCSAQSVFDSVIYSARIGITLNPSFGFAYLVPRGGKCCLDIGYRGWCATLKSYGSVKHIDAHIVYEDEKFDWNPADQILKHKPKFAKTEEDQKKRSIVCAYSVAILPTGEKVYEVIPAWELSKIKNVSSASKGFSPYTEWEGEMIRKAPIKRLAKKLMTLQSDDRVNAMFEVENQIYAEKTSITLEEF